MADSPTALIFAPSQVRTARAIARAIDSDSAAPLDSCRVCTDLNAIHAALKQLPHRSCVLILLAGCQDELDQMVSLAAWFEDYPLILMPPDDHRNTWAKAHRLRPRYLMPSRVDLRALRAVVRKLSLRTMPDTAPGTREPTPVLMELKGRPKRFFRIKHGRTKYPCKSTLSIDTQPTLLTERKNHV